jgi:glycosyltransferase involved in cell wall biosynthesis
MHIVNSVLGDATGGRWQVVCDYSRVLSQNGHSVLMLLNRRHLPELSRLPKGVAVEALSSRGHYDFVSAWSVRRRLGRFAPDMAIAHCSRSVALLKTALKGIAPVVAVSHSNKVKRLLPADAYLALTPHIRDKIQQAGNAVAGKPCFVLPNMIDVDTSQCLAGRRPNRPLCIGALGRFDTVKGFDVFIEALGILKTRGCSFRAILGGNGTEAQQLMVRANQLGLDDRLQFPGWIEKVDRFFGAIDILCVPARSDAFGLTPLQAAAAGVPMVISRASGHMAMFGDQTEVLFAEIGDADSTATQLSRLMSDDALAEQLRQRAHQRVISSYSVEVVSDKLLQAIEIIYKSSNKYR